MEKTLNKRRSKIRDRPEENDTMVSEKVKKKRKTKLELKRLRYEEFAKKQQDLLEKIQSPAVINMREDIETIKDDLNLLCKAVVAIDEKSNFLSKASEVSKAQFEAYEKLSKLNFKKKSEMDNSENIDMKDLNNTPSKPEFKISTKDRPRMLRKFKPGIPKYKLREMAINMVTDKVDLPNTTSEEKSKVPGSSKLTENSTMPIEPIDASYQISEISEKSNFCNFSSINPWLSKIQDSWCVKKPSALKKMLTRESLISTYKCMAIDCSYTTICPTRFEAHLDHHESTASETKFLLYCPYCFYKGLSVSDISQHYKVHQYQKFQCGFCFYRSSTEGSTWEHSKTHHFIKDPVVYECPLKRNPVNSLSDLRLISNRRHFVSHLECSSCKIFFYTTFHYERHLAQHASNKMTRESSIRDFLTYEKLLKDNKVGLYECLFCDFGCSTRTEIRSHMQHHPRELLFICKRKSFLTEIDPNSIESVMIIELPVRADVKTLKFCRKDLNFLKI